MYCVYGFDKSNHCMCMYCVYGFDKSNPYMRDDGTYFPIAPVMRRVRAAARVRTIPTCVWLRMKGERRMSTTNMTRGHMAVIRERMPVGLFRTTRIMMHKPPAGIR